MWRIAHIYVIYPLCVFNCILDTIVNWGGKVMTDDQESHSGNEVLIWRNRDKKRLKREPHKDTPLEERATSGGH